MHRIFLTVFLFLFLSVSACAPTPGATATESLPTPVTITPASPATQSTPTVVGITPTTPPTATPRPTMSPTADNSSPTPDKTPPSITPLPGQFGTGSPEQAPRQLMDQVIADLAARLGIPAAEISVVSSEAVVWRDGSLGCPQPGMVYTQALVPGYRIILEAGGQNYDYHTSETTFFLCEN